MKKYAIVPIEPTSEMIEAAFAPKGFTMDGYPNQHTLADKYKAMVEVAPMAVAVVLWIGERIELVETVLKEIKQDE